MSPAITGAGCLCAGGLNMEECVASLFKERKMPQPPTRFTVDYGDAIPVYQLPERFLEEHPVDLEKRTLTTHMAIVAANQAVEQAGLTTDDLASHKVGVIVGTTVGCAMNDEPYYYSYLDGEDPDLGPINRFLDDNPADAIARELGCLGPTQAIVNACTSGGDAMILGRDWIESGLCDIVLVGGSDELNRVTYYGFRSLMVAAPEECKPFDATRKGLNLGEGAAILVMESDKSRAKRNAKPIGHFVGGGLCGDGHHPTAPSPDGIGLRKAMASALADNALSMNDIAFINAHGTGTKSNDQVESTVLDEEMPGVPTLSTKGFTGHTLGAAGAIEAVFTLGCLAEGKLPASPGFAVRGDDTPAALTTETTSFCGTVALSESLGFGGNNTVIALALEKEDG
jgi:3-oxoacyl-(acyl-carrier-protein) synthase